MDALLGHLLTKIQSKSVPEKTGNMKEHEKQRKIGKQRLKVYVSVMFDKSARYTPASSRAFSLNAYTVPALSTHASTLDADWLVALL